MHMFMHMQTAESTSNTRNLKRMFCFALVLWLGAIEGALAFESSSPLCRCASEDQADEIQHGDIIILSRDTVACRSASLEDDDVFPCPRLSTMRRDERDLNIFVAGRTGKATSEVPQTYFSLLDEPERAYRPKKEIPPTVSPRPTASPVTSTPSSSPPTRGPTSIPTLSPTTVPTAAVIVVTRSPTQAPEPTAVPSLLPLFSGGSITRMPTSPTPPPTPAPTTTATSGPSLNPTPRPSDVPTVRPSSSLTSFPTNEPTPTLQDQLERDTTTPTKGPTTSPAGNPTTVFQSFLPTSTPTGTGIPTESLQYETPHPSSAPIMRNNGEDVTMIPTRSPVDSPTISPTKIPVMTISPTQFPTKSPSSIPTPSPSSDPTFTPTTVPILGIPTALPTASPSSSPTSSPSSDPTVSPTSFPILGVPSSSPTLSPSSAPSTAPSADPTFNPTSVPIVGIPTVSPTMSPSTAYPSSDPTVNPTSVPTSGIPTASPTVSPSSAPTLSPSSDPTGIPTLAPIFGIPTASPSNIPTVSPTSSPTEVPLSTTATRPAETAGPTPVPTPFNSLTTWPTFTSWPTISPTATMFPTTDDVQWEQLDADYLYESASDESFGSALSLSDDGTILTVGGFMNSQNQLNAGRIVRYDLSDDGSSTEVYGEEEAFIGFQIAASSDGNRQVAFLSNTGVIEILDYSAQSGQFELISTFTPLVFPGSSNFALSGNGNWLALVGEDYIEETGLTRVLLFLYNFDQATQSFIQSGDVFVVSTAITEEWGEFDISMTHDGSYVAVSQIGQGEFTGEIRVYRRVSTGLSLVGSPFVSDNTEDDFGRDVEILVTASGQIIIGFSVVVEDAVYVYTFEDGDWEALGSPLDGTAYLGRPSEFGFSISFNNRGDRLLVGAPGFSDPGFSDYAGAVIVFQFINSQWFQLGQGLGGASGSSFGEAVHFDGDGSTFAVGAPLDCIDAEAGICGGSVYVFQAGR